MTEDALPMAVRMIDTPAAIKALADPLRLKLLHLLMGDVRRTWTVKEMAADLNQPVTKLYHHVKQLEAADLIEDVATRVVSGIVEHQYRAGQRGLRFDDALFTEPGVRDDSIAQVSAMMTEVSDKLLHFLGQPDSDLSHVTVLQVRARLTADETEEINVAIEEVMQRDRADRDDPARRDLPLTTMLFLMHPEG